MSNIPQYFAQIDDNNFVIDIAVVAHSYMAENPDRYYGTWVETFVNLPNKTYAGIGFIYNAEINDFISPQPFPSWSLDENYDWQAPIERPADGKLYSWDEANQVWVEFPAI